MSALAKIKKTATQHEQDRQYDKALAEYARLLDGAAGSDEDVDVTLYNRAGDLALRAGDVPRAVTYFERAIDLYAAGGFLNNAVALAVKILRHAPGHLAAHHTLGVLYGRKGFRAEARQHLADYAAQMHRAGRTEEVGRTLGELAALGASADEVASVRELLTARAASPDDAGALVKLFDVALGPAARAVAGAAPSATPASLPLSELIEFEIRGPRLAPVTHDASARAGAAVRWVAALPGDPAPLRISALQAANTAGLDLLDVDDEVGASDASRPHGVAGTTASNADVAPCFDVEPFDVTTFEIADPDGAAFDAFEVGDVGASAARVEAPLPDARFLDVPFLDVPLLDGSLVERPSAEPPTFDAPRFELAMIDVPDVDAAPVELPMLDLSGAEVAATESDAAQIEMAQIEVAEIEVEGQVPDISPARGWSPDALAGAVDELASGGVASPAATAAAASLDGPVDLGEWLRSTEVTASTRLVTSAPYQSGDESADFDAALHAFTAGIAQSVDAGDRESHYDLGVAFREMGLLTDAVREFQRALAAGGSGLREREALAQCFLDLGRPELALATLEQAARDAFAAGASSETLVGVHYVLAEAARGVGRADDARAWYVRVLATDYGFRDAAARLAALPPPEIPASTQ